MYLSYFYTNYIVYILYAFRFFITNTKELHQCLLPVVGLLNIHLFDQIKNSNWLRSLHWTCIKNKNCLPIIDQSRVWVWISLTEWQGPFEVSLQMILVFIHGLSDSYRNCFWLLFVSYFTCLSCLHPHQPISFVLNHQDKDHHNWQLGTPSGLVTTKYM